MRFLITCLALCLTGIATQASAASDCDISAITDDEWLSPDPTTLAEVPSNIAVVFIQSHVDNLTQDDKRRLIAEAPQFSVRGPLLAKWAEHLAKVRHDHCKSLK